MTGAHIHLLLTHVPVMGIVFGTLVLAYAWIRGRKEAIQIGLGIFALSALAAVVVYLTGEAAEEAVEGLAGVSEAVIERHEEAALVALVATLGLGVLSLIGLWLSRRAVPRWFSGGLLAMALVVNGVMAWTANLGGQINHPEIRSTTTAFAPASQDAGDREAHEHDD